MIPPQLLVRIARLARQRPSRLKAAVVFGALALVAAVATVEAVWGWPEALTAERARLPGPSR